ncbi:hypothetical protein SF148580_4373 [Shigella flexneri 1485-80]|nr:hypothetical protein SF148580_4373 [Shigella flexneri 1485-80]
MATITPVFFNPIKAINNPIPLVIPIRKLKGMLVMLPTY